MNDAIFIRYLCLVLGLLSAAGCTSSKPAPKPLASVSVAKVEQRDVPIHVDAIGQAISPVTVQVRPQVAGKLIATYLEQGDLVKEGQIIYTVDPRPYQAILDQAKAQLAHDIALLTYADKTVERYKKVLQEDFIAILTFEQYVSTAEAAKAQVELDKAAVRAAQINVDFCNIVAPVSGKISYFVVDVGNIVAVDDPTAITSIKPFSPIDVLFSVPQQQLEMIRAVQGNSGEWPFIAILPEFPDEKFTGTTFFIDNQVNQDTGTILLKGRLANAQWEFWPGEFIKVKVLYRIAPNALVVPPGAILIGKDGPYVYTVDSAEKVSPHNVTVLSRTNEYIAFESDAVKEGDSVVTDGQINIAPGMKVNIVAASTDKQQKTNPVTPY
jgi:multidrug efflux system membrane fusion protein